MLEDDDNDVEDGLLEDGIEIADDSDTPAHLIPLASAAESGDVDALRLAIDFALFHMKQLRMIFYGTAIVVWANKVILTHEHADAILGLDDVRSVQPCSPTNDISPTPIYLTEHSMSSIATKFPYLVQKKLKEGQEIRRVAQLDWKIIESSCDKTFVVSGLQLVPLPVMHGEDYIALGFLFGEKHKVAYVSDVSRFLPDTEFVISKTGGGQVDLLILDALYRTGSHNTHFCFDQTLDAVKRICPKLPCCSSC